MKDNITKLSAALRQIEEPCNQYGNWLERIASLISSSLKHDHAIVHPCIINSRKTLVYERSLNKNPVAFELVVEFARTHGYQLKEDQRDSFFDGVKRVKNNHHTNTVSVLVLTAELMSQAALAKSPIEEENVYQHFNNEVTPVYVEAGLDFYSYTTQKELVSGLLRWINSHSSFKYDIDNIPTIKKVTAREIAEIAFGGKLPAAIDANNLKIFGLYNFNDQTVYLRDIVDLKSTQGKGILLHELVHYLQYQTGIRKNVKCKNELEALAYVLEARFFESQHHRHSITSSHINKVSQCRI